MKKRDVVSLIYWIVIFGGFIAYFFTVIREHFTSSSVDNWFIYYLFVVATIAASIIFNGIMHEILHMLGAKMGKYRITSVSMFGATLYKETGKTKFKFGKFDGLTGETKITPKEKYEKTANPSAFIVLFSLFMVIEIVGLYFVFAFFKNDTNKVTQDFGYFSLTALLTAAAIWLYDLLPIAMDNMTDGYRLYLSKKEGREKFNRNLIEANGGAIPTEETNEGEVVETVPTGNNEITLYYHLGKENIEAANEVVLAMLNDPNLSKKYYLDVKCYDIFFKLSTMSLEEGQKFYDDNVSIEERREIGDVKSISKCLAYILMSGLYDKSLSECLLASNKIKKLIAREANKRKEIDQKLYLQALDMVKEHHPNWEI